MDSLITTFHIDWKIIIAQVINFGLVFLVLYLFALKPLKKLMSERENKIAKGVTDAKENAELIEKTKKEYDAVLNKARTEANTIFQEGKREADLKKAEMLENAKKEVDTMIASGKKTLEGEKAKIIEEAKKEIVSLVVLATEKVLKDNDDVKINDKMVKQINNM
jgi:F-type H+-transporting ATPase subunit b